MESLLPEYDAQGVRARARGGALPGIAPSNPYPCRDGDYVLIAGNADSIFKRLMSAIGRDDLRDDPALADNDGRARADGAHRRGDRRVDLEAHVRTRCWRAWRRPRCRPGRIYTAADIAADPHYAARGMIAGGPRRRRRAAEGAGHHPEALAPRPAPSAARRRSWASTPKRSCAELGYGEDEIARLRAANVV